MLITSKTLEEGSEKLANKGLSTDILELLLLLGGRGEGEAKITAEVETLSDPSGQEASLTVSAAYRDEVHFHKLEPDVLAKMTVLDLTAPESVSKVTYRLSHLGAAVAHLLMLRDCSNVDVNIIDDAILRILEAV